MISPNYDSHINPSGSTPIPATHCSFGECPCGHSDNCDIWRKFQHYATEDTEYGLFVWDLMNEISDLHLHVSHVIRQLEDLDIRDTYRSVHRDDSCEKNLILNLNRLDAGTSTSNLEMHPIDLGELYLLLCIYIHCYGTGERDSELLHEIEKKFRSMYKIYHQKETPADDSVVGKMNQVAVVDSDQAARIWQMYAEEKSIHDIAVAESCSEDYVHRLIHSTIDQND